MHAASETAGLMIQIGPTSLAVGGTLSDMRVTLVLMVFGLGSAGMAACGGGANDEGPNAATGQVTSASTTGNGGAGAGGASGSGGNVVGAGGGPSTPGCGLSAIDPSGGVNVTIEAGEQGDGARRFHLVIPSDYDPERPHRVIIGYPGTNWVGEQIRPYLKLEDGKRTDEIFVYPDPLWRDFDGWGNLGGWLLGPHASPADGHADLVFTEKILDYLEEHYCIDTERIFVTGHSWGGDMAQVVSCFMGDRVRAAVPVAANRPYWFETGNGWADCLGDTAVWTFFGIADDHFSNQAYPGEFGDEQRDFWVDARECSGASFSKQLDDGPEGECVEYEGCSSTTRYCLYGPQSKHQVPAYYSAATLRFFRSF